MAEEAGGVTPPAPAAPTQGVAAAPAPIAQAAQELTQGHGAETAAMFDALQGMPGAQAVVDQINASRQAAAAEAAPPAQPMVPVQTPAPQVQQPAEPQVLSPSQRATEAPTGQETQPQPAQQQQPSNPPAGEPIAAPEASQAVDPIVLNSPMFGKEGRNIGGPPVAPEQPLQFENLDQVGQYMKETLGVDSYDSLTAEWNSMKGATEELSSVQAKLQNAEQFIATMPPELYAGATAHVNGKEWRDVVGQTPVFDFSKNAEQQESKSLVNAYFPGKLNEEMWAEHADTDGDAASKTAVNAMIAAAGAQYTVQQNEFAAQQKAVIENAETQQRNLQVSVANTIAKLPSQIEGIDSAYVTDVESKLNGRGIYDVFFNQDGTLREDAAHRFVMATDGISLMDQYQKAALNKANSSVRQEMLLQASTTPPPVAGAAVSLEDGIRPEVQAELDAINGFGKGKTY